jgi:hypothetical protein
MQSSPFVTMGVQSHWRCASQFFKCGDRVGFAEWFSFSRQIRSFLSPQKKRNIPIPISRKQRRIQSAPRNIKFWSLLTTTSILTNKYLERIYLKKFNPSLKSVPSHLEIIHISTLAHIGLKSCDIITRDQTTASRFYALIVVKILTIANWYIILSKAS